VDNVLVDPHDARFMGQANATLRRYGLQIKCPGCRPSARPVRGQAEEIYYRPKRTVAIQVTDLAGKVKVVHLVQSFNGSPLVAHRLDRTPFVERKTNIKFENGMAKSVQHEKPSEALGLMTAVGNVAGAIVFAPFNALTTQTNNVGTEKKYLAAREELLKQQQQWAAAQASASQRAATPTSFSQPPPPADREKLDDTSERVKNLERQLLEMQK
jgi:hypothetical protein